MSDFGLPGIWSALFETHSPTDFSQASQTRPPRTANDPAPPAAAHVIGRLPEVVITKADLDEDSTCNLECAVCLNAQRIGQLALKLPCGHLFCKDCVVPWLQRKCTCPSCRFELETDDVEYENIRRAKMRNFRFRFRRGELRAMGPSALRSLASSLGVSTTGCLDKTDIIANIAASDRAIVVESSPQIYSQEELGNMSMAELRNLMTSLGVVPQSAARDRFDLIEALRVSGRVTVGETSNWTSREEEEQRLMGLRVAELRQLLRQREISDSQFVEKTEMVKTKIKVKKETSVVAHAGAVNCGRFYRPEHAETSFDSSSQIWYASGSRDDKRVNIWKLPETSARASLSGHSSGVSTLAVDQKGVSLISGCVGGSVRLWDVQAEKCVTSVVGHAAAVKTSEFHPFGNFFATAGADGSIKIWDARNKKPVQHYRTDGDVSDLKFSPHGRWLACAGSFGVKMFDLGKAAAVWEYREKEISTVSFNPVDFYFLTSEKQTQIWNCTVENLGNLAFSDQHLFPTVVTHVAFTTDGTGVFQAAGANLRLSRIGADGSLITAGNSLVDAPWKSGRILDILSDGNSDCLVLAADAADGLFAPNLSVHRVDSKGERKGKRDIPVEIFTSPSVAPMQSSSASLSQTSVKATSREIARLNNHLANLRRIVALWSKGSTIQAISEAAQDAALFGNLLFALPLEKQNVPLSLDLCRQLLILMPRALADSRSEILLRGCLHATRILLSRFGDFIRETRESEISGAAATGVDLQRELRLEKCNECFDGFKKVFGVLLKSAHILDKDHFDILRSYVSN